MRISEIIDNSSTASTEGPPEDVIALMDSAGAARGVHNASSAKVRAIGPGGANIGSRWVEIPLVGGRGEISGVLCQSMPPSDVLVASVSCGPRDAKAIEDTAQLVIHDINNLFAVIGSGLSLLEYQSDGAYRNAIFSRMQHAITRGALLTRQLLDAARQSPGSIGAFVAGCRLTALVGTLDEAFGPGIAVRTDIAPDLWDFDADPEELYFALLNLCRNAADAIPKGGAIMVGARNVEPSSAGRGFVEIVVADDGDGMTDEVLSRAFTPYFTTKAAGNGTGLGLAHVQRFAEGRGGAVGIDSTLGVGTVVHLFLPRVGDAAVPSSLAGEEITYTPAPSGGVFRIVNPTKAAPTS